jgi:hypothetical protein
MTYHAYKNSDIDTNINSIDKHIVMTNILKSKPCNILLECSFNANVYLYY